METIVEELLVENKGEEFLVENLWWKTFGGKHLVVGEQDDNIDQMKQF